MIQCLFPVSFDSFMLPLSVCNVIDGIFACFADRTWLTGVREGWQGWSRPCVLLGLRRRGVRPGDARRGERVPRLE